MKAADERRLLPGYIGLAIPRAWDRIPWDKLRGVVMVVGAVDTGKSTLIKFLWGQLAPHRRLAVVDADVGQATLGPPTTQTLRLASEEVPEEFPPRGRIARWFVGAISPRGHMLPTVIGVHRLTSLARRWGAETILVDTTGMVSPSVGGVALKWAKFDLVQPNVVIVLQRERELEPLIAPWRSVQRFVLVELPTSPLVRTRSREERIAWRQQRFRLYFRRARLLSVPLQAFSLLYDRTATAGGTVLVPGQLVGFLDRWGFLMALGIVRRIGDQNIEVFTPLRDLGRVAALRPGSIVLDEDYRDRRLSFRATAPSPSTVDASPTMSSPDASSPSSP